jgi:uncharacterized protein (TIGR03067 family)
MLGVTLSQNWTQAAVPVALTESTLKAALAYAAGPGMAGGIAAPVLAHSEGMLRSLSLTKFKLKAMILLAVTVVAAGAGVLCDRLGPEVPAGKQPPPKSTPRGNVTPAKQASPRRVSDGKALQGAWIITAAEQQGRGTNVLNGRRLVFKGDGSFTLNEGGEVPGIIPRAPMEGGFTLQPGDPKAIELKHLRGIYSLDSAKLMICLSPPLAKERPVKFSTKPGSRQLLLTLERE